MYNKRNNIILLVVSGLIAISVGIRYLSNHVKPEKYIFPVLCIIGGSVMYFISILYLGAKNRRLIIAMMVTGWIVAAILNVFLWRHNFYFVCKPPYELKQTDLDSSWTGEKLALGNDVFGLKLFLKE